MWGILFVRVSTVCRVCYLYTCTRALCLFVCVFSTRWIQWEEKGGRQALRLPPSPCFGDSKQRFKRDSVLCTSVQTFFNYQDQKRLHEPQSLAHINCQFDFILWITTPPFSSFSCVFVRLMPSYCKKMFLLELIMNP